jgi:hypothetical protein
MNILDIEMIFLKIKTASHIAQLADLYSNENGLPENTFIGH